MWAPLWASTRGRASTCFITQTMFARTILRMPEPNKFDKGELAKIAVTLWDLHVPREVDVGFKEKNEKTQDLGKEKVGYAAGFHQGVRHRAVWHDARVPQV